MKINNNLMEIKIKWRNY